MSDVYIYADETGNLDYKAAEKPQGKDYFGFGTATYTGEHGDDMFAGMKLRADLERKGLSLSRGFHAIADSWPTRNEVYEHFAGHDFRFDITLLAKSNAYDYVRDRGEMHLYKMAWYLHIKEIAKRVTTKDDTVYIIVGTFGTKQRAEQAKLAVRDVCSKLDRDITVCVWEAATSWGLQVADYATWAVQRQIYQGPFNHYNNVINPLKTTEFYPWGKTNEAKKGPAIP